MKLNNKYRNGAPLKVIPIGGLNEIGKNMTLLEYKDNMIIIDCGLSFPDDELYGIDIVIPDFSYVVENKEKLKGMILTHGHEDHIGGIPYLLSQVSMPIYGTQLTLGLVENKLKEHNIKAKLNIIKPGDTAKLGVFECEAIRSTHSVADSICLCIDTPVGKIFHTGDFKIDYTPIQGEPMDFARISQLGKEGIRLMLCDSTNVTRPGYSMSEQTVGNTIENIFRNSEARILIATFSSNVHRVQRIIDNAVLFNRKVAISGRSMLNVMNLAMELGYLKVPANVLVDINKTKNIPDKELVIITTGSQGEPMSALSRMATKEHKAIQIKKGDVVILSSSPVPGNEKTVSNIVNKLFELGAEVIYSDIADIHVSGHACQEELKLMHSLVKPELFMPVHGEYRHLEMHSQLAQSLGTPAENVFILENGDALSITSKKAQVLKEQAPASAVYVDGLGVGDVGSIVLRDRKLLSESGLIIVVAAIGRMDKEIYSGPEIVTRGFIYVKENEDLIGEARNIAKDTINSCLYKNIRDWTTIKMAIREALRSFIYKKTKRSPLILPIFLDL